MNNNKSLCDPSDKDITSFIKEWMFKKFKDESYIQIKKDYESGLINKYEDPYFPPNNDSLGQKIVKKFKDLIWRRAPEFIENMQILNLETEQKVNQGRIGDCYLLNPIGLLGLIQKNMISRLFTIKQSNKFGYYSVWLFIDGRWQYINVDDSFPWWITRKKPYFCDIVDETQIWAMIIEKAWAKLNGEYSRLWGGDTGLAFRVITGAPTKSYGLKKYRKDPRKKEYVYKQIDYHLNQGHLISVTTGALDDYGKSIMTQGHSYALIGYKKEENKYIIRDPRGPTNVFGKEIYEIDQDQLIYLFQCVIVCLLNPSYLFSQHEILFENEQLKQERLIKIKIERKTKFHLSFFQPNKRYFKLSEKGKKHKLSKITVKVLKIDSKDGQITKVKTISQRNGKLQQMDLEINLNKGSYYIYCLVEWNSVEHRKINICSYGPHFIEFINLQTEKKLTQLKEFLEIQKQKREEQKKNKQNAKNTIKQKLPQENIIQNSKKDVIIPSSSLKTESTTTAADKKQTELNILQLQNQNKLIDSSKIQDPKEINKDRNNDNVKQTPSSLQEREQNTIRIKGYSDISNNKLLRSSKIGNSYQENLETQINKDQSNIPIYQQRTQSKSKTLITQKRYSLNTSQNRIPSPITQQIGNNDQVQNTQKLIQNEDIEGLNTITQRQSQKKNTATFSDRIQIKQQPQSKTIIIKQSIQNNQNQSKPLNIPLPPSVLTQKQNIQQQLDKTQKGNLKMLKDQIGQKTLPPICPSPKMKQYIGFKNQSQNGILSYTEKKANKQEQICTYSEIKVKYNDEEQQIKSMLNFNNQIGQDQLFNQHKTTIISEQTPLKNVSNSNNNIISNINLFKQFSEYRNQSNLPHDQKQNLAIFSKNQQINNQILNKRKYIRAQQLYKSNI